MDGSFKEKDRLTGILTREYFDASAKEIIDENSELKILDGYLFSDSYGIAVKKGNSELLESINTVLSKLIDDGKIEEYVIKHSE